MKYRYRKPMSNNFKCLAFFIILSEHSEGMIGAGDTCNLNSLNVNKNIKEVSVSSNGAGEGVKIKTSYSNPLSITGEGISKIGNLNIYDGAVLREVNHVENINLLGRGRWSAKDVCNDAGSVYIKGKAYTVFWGEYGRKRDNSIYLRFTKDYQYPNIKVYCEPGGAVSSIDFYGYVVREHRPDLYIVQRGGDIRSIYGSAAKNDVLEVCAGKIKENVSFISNIIINGRKWKSLLVNETENIEIKNGGKIRLIRESKETPLPDSNVGNVYIIKTLPFSIKNYGKVKKVDFSESRHCGKFTYEQHEGKTRVIDGRSEDPGDELRVYGGEVRWAKVKTLELYGGTVQRALAREVNVKKEGWISKEIVNPSLIRVEKNISLDKIKIGSMNGNIIQKNSLAVEYTENINALQASSVVLATGGNIKSIDLSEKKRPAFHIVNEGKHLGSLIGRSGKGDRIDMRDSSSVTGNISGIDHITFSGDATRFGGTYISTADNVNVTGRLTMTSTNGIRISHNHKNPDVYGLHIQEKGKLSLPLMKSRTLLTVDGTYKQDGVLAVMIDSKTTVNKPFIKARQVMIGDNAILNASCGTEIKKKKSYLLMTSDTAIDKPIKKITGQYYQYKTKVDGKKLLLCVKDLGYKVSKKALKGGANESAKKSLETAVCPKAKKPQITKAGEVNDLLNRWVMKQFVKDCNNPGAIAKIARQLTPDNTGATVRLSRAGMSQAGMAIDARQLALRTGITTGDMVLGGRCWMQYAYNNALQRDKDGVYGFQAQTSGYTLGADVDINEHLNGGFAYTFAHGDTKGKGESNNEVGTDGHIFSLYSTVNAGRYFVDSILSWSWNRNNVKRYILSNETHATYDINAWSLSVKCGYNFPLNSVNNWYWQPLLGFNYAQVHTENYKEKSDGGDADALYFDKVQNRQFDVLELGTGLKITGAFEFEEELKLRSEASIMAYHDFNDDPVKVTAHYAEGGNQFFVYGRNRIQNRYQLAAGLNIDLQDNFNVSFSFAYNWMDCFRGYTGLLRGVYYF